jgi:hypothetical protein
VREPGERSTAWFWVLVAVASAGILRDVSVYFWKPGALRTLRIDDRFAPLLTQLPAGERLGFVTDAPGDLAGSHYFDVLYALAPRAVDPGPDARLIVADLQDAAALPKVCARFGLRVVARGGAGAALLEHE